MRIHDPPEVTAPVPAPAWQAMPHVHVSFWERILERYGLPTFFAVGMGVAVYKLVTVEQEAHQRQVASLEQSFNKLNDNVTQLNATTSKQSETLSAIRLSLEGKPLRR